MSEFLLVSEIGGVAQLECPTCFVKFTKAAYMLKYESVSGRIVVFIECPNCFLKDWSYMED